MKDTKNTLLDEWYERVYLIVNLQPDNTIKYSPNIE